MSIDDALRVIVKYGGQSAVYRTHDIEDAKQDAVEGASIRIMTLTGETVWTTDEPVEASGPLSRHAMFWLVAQSQPKKVAAE